MKNIHKSIIIVIIGFILLTLSEGIIPLVLLGLFLFLFGAISIGSVGEIIFGKDI